MRRELRIYIYRSVPVFRREAVFEPDMKYRDARHLLRRAKSHRLF
jgi:hypothetical protein